MKTIVLFLTLAMLSLTGKAQTFTTIAAGNWSSPSTWAGGVAPLKIIYAGQIVNIGHAVTFNMNDNLEISGVLNITADSLRFVSGYNKDIQVKSGGILKVNNAGLLLNMQSATSTLKVDGGYIQFNNAKVTVSQDFEADKGSSRSIKNSTLIIGKNYDLEGESGYTTVDTIQFSVVETNTLNNGEFRIQSNSTLRVANAYVNIKNNSKLKIDNAATVATLPGANGNFGFDYLRVTDEFNNDGTWNARIDATCVSGIIAGTQMNEIDFTRSQDCSATPLIGAAPELTFTNPVLVSGIANKQGAVYRFANVTTGVDAQIRLKKFSRSDIVMENIDLPNLGWDKAFQPNFGLNGTVPANQNWYIDFELKFYEAGTNTIKVLPKVDMTALDVDGNGASLSEYASFQNPSNVSYSTLNYLTEQSSNFTGQLFTCPLDAISSVLISCFICGGDGKTGPWNLTDCSVCDATGLLHAGCNHGFEGVNASTVNGPITNFINIDTAATQVMAVYQFTDRSVINFRYGAKTGSTGSGAGVRLNSLWFRQFSLAPVINIVVLPLKLNSFTATLANSNKVDIKWVSETETNLSHYVVERSFDGSNFNEAGVVFAYGNTTQKSNYSLADNITGITSPVIYYRLRSVDADGKTHYSETRIIRLGKKADNDIMIVAFPNPVTNEIRISVPNAWQNKKVTYEVLNMNGQVAFRTETANSSQTETLNLARFVSGIYFVRVSCGGEVAQQKIIKQ